MPAAKPTPPPARIQIEHPEPAVDCGRFPAKRTVGDAVAVSCDVYRDGHELLRAVVRYRGPSGGRWREAELRAIDAGRDGVRWGGVFVVDRPGRWTYTIEAWTDVFATWRDELRRKLDAGQRALGGELGEGVLVLGATAARAAGVDRRLIDHALSVLTDASMPEAAKHDVALGDELLAAVRRSANRHGAVVLDPPLSVEVDRVRARFGAWYELFPRSWGGLRGVLENVPRLAELGFDVLYLPPIHPIGRTNRKGADDAPAAGPGDPGSPWAIGDAAGGHDAVHPELGTLDDVRELCAVAAAHGIDVALDLAIQCSPDHPWLTEHPDWFHRRPDGSLKYAENPPKRYQDIHGLNWESPDWRALWEELRRVVLHWVSLGVKAFRVDNPHTKPIPFWTWLIAEVHKVDRDVIFLAEAFTRRAMMRRLAQAGFSQSYTYFTWKNSRRELTEYVDELAWGPEREYFRPNFFANTPDILNGYLVHGGPAAFHARFVLAATLSPSYGIYSGFEHYEAGPLREGSEEYRDSEKFALRERRLDGPMLPFIARVNRARRERPALQHLSNIAWLETDNEALIAYLKQHDDDSVICVVNLDPHHAQEGAAMVPAHLRLPPAFGVRDLLTGERFDWRIGSNYVRLDPDARQAHILSVEPA